jgi:flavin reductase (DIM6/NTAB) family NADH-FMN oxidoreductase RutF
MAVHDRPVRVRLDRSIWSRVFTVAPLVLIATREQGGGHDIAPKHMAMPLGWGSRYCFACTPAHGTYRNIAESGEFTVSFPRPEMVVQAGLAATARGVDGSKPTLAALETFPADVVDGVLVAGCRLFLECRLDRIVDGFDEASLVVGDVVAASACEDALRMSDGDDAELLRAGPLLAFLPPDRFATIGESFSFPFPADFRR